MIVVLGSRHDVAAARLVASWPGAALCSAEDLVRPGWAWHRDERRGRTWIIEGRPVRDEAVSGVFVRRSAVYADELGSIHPADRAFVAAEAHAFLAFVLATTAATVINPVLDGAFGEEALRPERWGAAAREAGVRMRPLRIASGSRPRGPAQACAVEVVGSAVFGNVPRRILKSARRLSEATGLAWAVFAFDSRGRLVSVSSACPPSDAAAGALGRLLAGGPR